MMQLFSGSNGSGLIDDLGTIKQLLGRLLTAIEELNRNTAPIPQADGFYLPFHATASNNKSPYTGRITSILVSADMTGQYGLYIGSNTAVNLHQFHLTAYVPVEIPIGGPRGLPIGRDALYGIDTSNANGATVLGGLVGYAEA